LVHITAIAGTDWDLTDAPTLPFEGAALKIAGTIDVLHIVNSVFSFAAGASNSVSVRYTGIDLSERDDLPIEFASQGNIISTPGFDLYPNAEGSLVYCAPRSVSEFGNAFTQDDLQVGIGYTCGGEVPDSSRWNTGSNIALTEAPNPARGDLGAMLPWCTGATADGYLIAALEELPPPPLASSGMTLADAPYGTNAPADRGGRIRDPGNREAAGAWLPVPQIDPPPIIPPGPFTP
jgi:hypothetical protein